MIQTNPHVASEETDFQNAETLTADELGLVVRTPKPEEVLLDIEKHLREFGLRSGG